ncbi:hypothetical protein [Chitinophaga rhizophila]|uniref:YD repeat-containing protein n=1 Tax=Chitinophaga rhizophila TaxID=2866212 RepID=A0ABS7GH86_9BACT|nr:hypothetical protein [Chitinophaga rhizophila]MBW8687056.1 hypothetical protein [Chitinophaga rhizophila]
MKSTIRIFRLIPLAIIFMAMLSACKKETTTCCQTTDIDYVWELKYLSLDRFIGAGIRDMSRHEFTYNEFGKVKYYHVRTDFINPATPFDRTDTFFYDSQQRVSYILGDHSSYPAERYKKEFSYDGSGRRTLSKKYLLNTTLNSYYLVDSTVYQYQDTVISKIAHYANKAPDTAVFVYNSQQNLVSVRMNGLESVYQELSDYDNRPNALRQTHMESLEIEPSYTWLDDIRILMAAPKLPKNNFQTRRLPLLDITHYYTSAYGDLYNLLNSTYIELPVAIRYSQIYQYNARN